MLKYTHKELTVMQKWSLDKKLYETQKYIKEWYEYHKGKVFVSFSGGKDSTVLFDIARKMYPNIHAVFVDTGMEYPELREFVNSKDNITVLHPKFVFSEIIEKYGYPVISKEVSNVIYGARKGQHYRLARINGLILDKNGNKSKFNCEKYKYLMNAPFLISDRCCYHMKKSPIAKYERKTGEKGIIGTMASESKIRLQAWLKTGTNTFEGSNIVSKPLSFWNDEDILQYIKRTGISYASIYGDIVEMNNKKGNPILTTTGVARSGCMFCMYGVHLERKPNRFQLMQVQHPKQYDYCINQLGCGKVMDFIGVDYKVEEIA